MDPAVSMDQSDMDWDLSDQSDMDMSVQSENDVSFLEVKPSEADSRSR